MRKRLDQSRAADGTREPVAETLLEARLQPFGALLVLDAVTLRTLRSTADAPRVLGVSRRTLLREPLSALLPPAARKLLSTFQSSGQDAQEAVFTLLEPRMAGRRRVPVGLHRRGGLLLVELLHRLPELTGTARPSCAETATRALALSHHRLGQAQSLPELCQRAAELVKAHLGFSHAAVLRYESSGAACTQAVVGDPGGTAAPPREFAAAALPWMKGSGGRRNELVVLADAAAEPVELSLGSAAAAPAVELTGLALHAVSAGCRAQVRALGGRAMLAVRLDLPGGGMDAEETPWGLLFCWDPRPQVPGAVERALLQALAQLLAAQLQVLSAQQDSQLTELRVRRAVEASGEPICILDMSGRTVLANAAFAALAGQPAHVLASRAGMESLLLDPEVPARIAAGLAAGGGYWQGEAAFRGAHGEPIPIDLRVDVITHPDGHPVGYVGICRDLRPRRLAERRRQESQRLDSLGILAAGIAHDFNNLLTGILGNASLLRAEVRRSRSTDSYLDQIEETALRAAELCKQMLAYAGKGQFTVREVALSALVQETVPLLDLGLRHPVRLQLDPQLPEVRGDSAQLRQVLENLLRNAAEALARRSAGPPPALTNRDRDRDRGRYRGRAGRSPAGPSLFARVPSSPPEGITVTTSLVTLDTEALRATRGDPEAEPGEYVALEVRDAGCGISQEVQARMFDPFFTTKPDGRGLGLSTVIGVVRRHGGVLRVHSVVGRGSTFTLLLPASRRPRPPQTESGDPAAAAQQPPGNVVLIVDDEEQVRNILGQLLTAAGFTVELYSDGSEAVERVKRGPAAIGLVLLDLTMRRMSGEATLARLLQLRGDLPIVMMSGYPESDLQPHLRARGVTAFLAKPFSPAQVLATVRQVLRAH